MLISENSHGTTLFKENISIQWFEHKKIIILKKLELHIYEKHLFKITFTLSQKYFSFDKLEWFKD